jgi:two-component system, response regulator PdtaR
MELRTAHREHAHRRRARAHHPSARRSMRVLLVDADAEAVMHLRKLVSDIGLHVVGMTNDGEHALQLAELLHPDVALINWSLPRFGGALTARLMLRRAPNVTAILLLDDVDLLEAGRSVSLYDGVGTLAKGPSPVEVRSLLAALRLRETRHLSLVPRSEDVAASGVGSG